jgi:uncharacterized membrane protein
MGHLRLKQASTRIRSMLESPAGRAVRADIGIEIKCGRTWRPTAGGDMGNDAAGDETMRALILAALVSASAGTAYAAPTDRDVAAAIVAKCRAIYHAGGRPCACPDDLARNGSRCGGRSAYVRPGGALPRCSVGDVSAHEIADYRVGKKDFIMDCAALG